MLDWNSMTSAPKVENLDTGRATLLGSQQCLQSSSIVLQYCQMQSHIGVFIGIIFRMRCIWWSCTRLYCEVSVCFYETGFLVIFWGSALCFLKAYNILLHSLPAPEPTIMRKNVCDIPLLYWLPQPHYPKCLSNTLSLVKLCEKKSSKAIAVHIT